MLARIGRITAGLAAAALVVGASLRRRVVQDLGAAERETGDSEAGREGAERTGAFTGTSSRTARGDAEVEADVLAPERQGDGGAHPPRQAGCRGQRASCRSARATAIRHDRQPRPSAERRRRSRGRQDVRERPHGEEPGRRDPRPGQGDRLASMVRVASDDAARVRHPPAAQGLDAHARAGVRRVDETAAAGVEPDVTEPEEEEVAGRSLRRGTCRPLESGRRCNAGARLRSGGRRTRRARSSRTRCAGKCRPSCSGLQELARVPHDLLAGHPLVAGVVVRPLRRRVRRGRSEPCEHECQEDENESEPQHQEGRRARAAQPAAGGSSTSQVKPVSSPTA